MNVKVGAAYKSGGQEVEEDDEFFRQVDELEAEGRKMEEYKPELFEWS